MADKAESVTTDDREAAKPRPKEQIVDPWRAVAGEGQTSIDYDKLIGTYYGSLPCMCIISMVSYMISLLRLSPRCACSSVWQPAN